jgi:hypothetical protein
MEPRNFHVRLVVQRGDVPQILGRTFDTMRELKQTLDRAIAYGHTKFINAGPIQFKRASITEMRRASNQAAVRDGSAAG